MFTDHMCRDGLFCRLSFTALVRFLKKRLVADGNDWLPKKSRKEAQPVDTHTLSFPQIVFAASFKF